MNWIRDKWKRFKKSIKRGLIALGVIGVALAAPIIISNPIPTGLKTDKANILYSEVQNQKDHNGKVDRVVEYKYISDEEDVYESDEIPELRTETTRTKRLNATQYIISTNDFLLTKKNGKWLKIKSATTTEKIFNESVSLGFFNVARADQTASTSPGVVDSSGDFSNPSNVLVSDNSDGWFTAAAGYVQVDQFGFSINASSVDGIIVEVECQYWAAATEDMDLRLAKAGTLVGNATSSDVCPASDGYITQGNASELWGTTWTEADIEDAGFGVRADNSDDETEIDHIRISVVYTPLAEAAPTITSVTDTPDPQTEGLDITFSVDWNDINGEGIKMFICKTDSISTTTPSCGGGEWCSDKNDFDLTDPITCNYTTQNADIAASPIDYFAFVCDNEISCSTTSSSTFSVQAIVNPKAIIQINSGAIPVNSGIIKLR